MKRILPILLCVLLLCAGCAERKTFNTETALRTEAPMEATPAPKAQTPAPAEAESTTAPTPEPTAEPTATPIPAPVLAPLYFDAWSLGVTHDKDIETFHCDLDQDGSTETVNVHLDAAAHTCTVTDGKRSIVLEDGCVLDGMILCDLDPTNPWLNLVVVLGENTSDYVTVELHPDGDTFARGVTLQTFTTEKHGEVAVLEEAYLLGWSYGYRHRFGEGLTPTTEWVTLKYIPSEEDLANEWESLVKYGDVLHVCRDVPCTIDGEAAFLPVDTYLYRLRYRDALDLMEVETLDGVVAQIAFTCEDGVYLIDGIPQTEYFDNLDL